MKRKKENFEEKRTNGTKSKRKGRNNHPLFAFAAEVLNVLADLLRQLTTAAVNVGGGLRPKLGVREGQLNNVAGVDAT